MQAFNRNAFSLIELALVLVVVGLVAGGITAGTSLVRTAEVKSVNSDLQHYQSAVQQFADKYKAVPGDMINAESYWDTAGAGCPSGLGSGTQTCNGNGNKQIDTDPEMFRFWQHLADAGMIDGGYTGVAGSGGAQHHVPGQNAPRGKMDKTGYGAMYRASVLGTINGNTLTFGKQTGSDLPSNGALTPQEASDFDVKYDDGKPGFGKVQQFTASSHPTCATTDVASTAVYAVTSNDKTCPLIYKFSAGNMTAAAAPIVPINGACNNSVALGCTAGSPGSDNGLVACGTTHQWICTGSGGGSDSGTCSYANPVCPINGVCNNAVALGCTTGTMSTDGGQVACGTTHTWHCDGSSGGTNATNCQKANAACAGCAADPGYGWVGGSSPAAYNSSDCTASLPALASGASTTLNAMHCNAVHGDTDGWTGIITVTCTDGALDKPSGSTGTCLHTNCFIGSVLVTMADGSTKPMSELKVGDIVKGKAGNNVVKALPVVSDDRPLYSFNGGEAFVTAGHPFMTQDGWKAIDPSQTPVEGHEINVTKLAVGDMIEREDGSSVKLTAIDEEHSGKHTLYNPVVGGDHTYYANGLLVHNKLGDLACDPPSCGSTQYTCDSGTPDFCIFHSCVASGAAGTDNHNWNCIEGSDSVHCSINGATMCFLPDVMVTLEDGSRKKISELQVGAAVRGQTGINHVLELPGFDVDQPVYGFNDGEKFVTGGHPFWTAKGWKAIDPALTPKEHHNVKTTKLEVGDVLLLDSGEPFTVRSIDREERASHHVFSPVMDGDHTYYANGLLVHNKTVLPCDDIEESCSGAPSGCAAGECEFTDNKNCATTCVHDGADKVDLYGPDKPKYHCASGVLGAPVFIMPGYIPPDCP